MFDEDQLVKISWNNFSKSWYEARGYTFTKEHDMFFVKARDLSLGSKARVLVTCDYCGNLFETQYAQMAIGRKQIFKDCCRECAGKKTSDVTKRKRAIRYINEANKVCSRNGYKLITTVDDYKDLRSPIEFICPKHGRQSMLVDNFLRGHKCRSCSYEERTEGLRLDKGFVASAIDSVNGNKLLNIDEYKDSVTTNLMIRCGSCGNIFTTSYANYTGHNVTKCRACSKKESRGESIIRDTLESNDICYEREKKFENCRDSRPLPFDFFVPDYNLVIEFDGMQHYYPAFGEKSFTQTVKHDKIKDSFCSSNNINILRIPYWDIDNISDIVLKEIAELGKRYSLVS